MRRELAPLPLSRPRTEGAIRHAHRPPLAPEDKPKAVLQVKSARCQQGSRIVSAAFAELRARLTFISWRAFIPLRAMVQTSSTMVV
jgi:hypothetical protein